MAIMIQQTILQRGNPVTTPSLSTWPLHVVRLADFGIDAAFLDSVRPSFDRTQWDRYDVLAGTLHYLTQLGGGVAAEATRARELSDDTARFAAVEALVVTLPPDERAHVATFRPHRRRAVRRYRLLRTDSGEWAIDPLEDTSFKQAVADYRSQPRTFALMEDAVACHPGMVRLLASAAETVHRYRPEVRAIDAYAHQVTVAARPRQSGHPAPEGLHQDGADFIVSAMVVERANVRGGTSRVYDGKGGTPVLEVELQRGEGILQMDAGSNLWHEISAVQVDDSRTEGHRMTFGLDLHVI